MTNSEPDVDASALLPERDDKDRGAELYSEFRNNNDQALRIGIFGGDIGAALADPRTITVDIGSGNNIAKVPVLAPIELLGWFNQVPVKDRFGDNVTALCYLHPPVYTENTAEEVFGILGNKLADGCVVVTEKYIDDETSPIARLIESAKQSDQISIERFGEEGLPAKVSFFAGVLSVEGGQSPVDSITFREANEKLVANGEAVIDKKNGPMYEETVVGEEVNRIWEFYSRKFDELGRDDPTQAGFTKEMLMDILADPEIAKFVYRQDGQVVSFMLLLQDFDKAPWFSRQYYENQYPDFVSTNNVMIFPGIVTDGSVRGVKYSTRLIRHAVDVFSQKKTAGLVTFECTQISSLYIPKIVSSAINGTRSSRITGLDRPIGGIEYFAISQTA